MSSPLPRRAAARRAVSAVPGVLALVCAVVGVTVLFGWAWAMLAAVPFLMLADHRSGA